jgi:general secretion pathway protein L
MATWVGLDIGATAVKAAVVRTAYRRVQLTGLSLVNVASAGSTEAAIRDAMASALGVPGVPGVRASAPLLPGAAPDPSLTDIEITLDGSTELTPEAKVTGLAGAAAPVSRVAPKLVFDAISTSIEGDKVAVRVVPLPSAAQKQMADVLPFELESQVPLDMDTSVFDWRLLTGPGAEEGTVRVLATVARTSDVQHRIDVIKDALGTEPERVGVGPFPLENLLPYASSLTADGPVCVLDLGTQSSEVIILRGGEPVFARSISFGAEGLPATASKLAREIRISLAAHRAAHGEAPVKIVLCGGGAFQSRAEEFLAGELEMPVETFRLNLQVDTAGVPEDLLASAPVFAKALGLAYGMVGRNHGLDLRKGPLAFERGFAWVKERIPILTALSVVVLVSLIFSAWAQLYSASKEKETLETALGLVTKDVLGEETTSAARAQELLELNTASADDDPLPHADAFDVMVKLSEHVPQSMVHDVEELDVAKGHVVLHGIVGSIPDAQSIASSLGSEKCFQDIKISRTNQMVGTSRQKYILEFDLRCPEDNKTVKKKSASDTAGGAASAAASAAGGT